MEQIQVPDFLEVANKLKDDTRRYAKVFVLQWFDDSFQKQGFTDASFQPWAVRKAPDRRPGGAILVDTTFLRKSLSVLEENQNQMEFGTHVPYAPIHNFGGRLRAIQNVRAHHRTRNGKREQVRPFTRKMNSVYEPRKFIGHSTLMMNGLDNWVIKEIVNRFNTL
ncbi:phage virion morphogenesis protein [Flavobacterium beibuense]|uniref:phage virion morphogenesis protein n=1 Tax=Flavobacterium beibuense TaxID=657326 RepID=UPI003A93A225